MKRFVKNKLVWLTVGGAIVFVMVTYLNQMYGWNWPKSQKILSYFLDDVSLYAWAVGALASGSVEVPNFVILWVTLFIIYIIIFGALVTLSWFVYKQMTKSRHSLEGWGVGGNSSLLTILGTVLRNLVTIFYTPFI
jgi:ABC-type multidrug transport system permease subunit